MPHSRLIKLISTVMQSAQPVFDYYVDQVNGSDVADGLTKATAWKTMNKVGTTVFGAGKRVGLKRGCTWRETWDVNEGGSAGNPVVFGAYGYGTAPKITGCDLLTNWTQYTVSAALFKDGFESGNVSAWSASTNPGGQLTVGAGGALVGSNGLSVSIASQVHAFVQDNTPNGEKTYRCRFYFDPNSITMGAAEEFLIIQALNTAPASVFFVKLQMVSGEYKLYVYERDDSWTAQTYQFTITDEPHYLELSWKASSAAGANDGTFACWIDGSAPAAAKTGIDSDTLTIDTIKLGAVLELDAGTSGTLFFDGFYSNNDGTAIGATDPVTTTSVYYATCDNGIDTFLLLEDGTPLTKAANLAGVNGVGKFWPDDANDTIYARCTDDTDPDTHVMEIGTRYDTVNCDNRAYISFENLHFHGAGGQYGRGFGLKRTTANPSNITLTNCEIDYCAYNGVQLNHVDGQTPIANFVMTGCKVHHNLDTGVWIIGESAAAKITGVQIKNCSIHNNGLTTAASMGMFIQGCDAPIVTNCQIYDNNGNLDWSDNLLIGTSSDVVITYNTIHGGNHTAIHIDVNTNGSIWFNTIYGCAWNGIWIEEHQTAVCGASTVYHNTVYDCLHGLVFGPGSTIREVSGVTVKNNIFTKCHRANVELNEDGVGPDYLNNTLDYNCYLADVTDPSYQGQFRAKAARENETFAQWKTYTSWDAHSLNVDPLLVNPAGLDFTLQSISNCINAGVAIAGIGQVALGSAPDMGRYEKA